MNTETITTEEGEMIECPRCGVLQDFIYFDINTGDNFCDQCITQADYFMSIDKVRKSIFYKFFKDETGGHVTP